MAEDREKFVSRWSRLKREAREQAEKPAAPKPESPADPQAPPPELPPVSELNFDSDYRGFLHPKIDEDTRRAALKKLFSDPRFNVIDDMDIDIEDYSKYAPLPAAVVASLKQTQNILQWARERKEAEAERERQLAEQKTRLAEGGDAAQGRTTPQPAADEGASAQAPAPRDPETKDPGAGTA